jgi:hypothetical protein
MRERWFESTRTRLLAAPNRDLLISNVLNAAHTLGTNYPSRTAEIAVQRLTGWTTVFQGVTPAPDSTNLSVQIFDVGHPIRGLVICGGKSDALPPQGVRVFQVSSNLLLFHE